AMPLRVVRPAKQQAAVDDRGVDLHQVRASVRWPARGSGRFACATKSRRGGKDLVELPEIIEQDVGRQSRPKLVGFRAIAEQAEAEGSPAHAAELLLDRSERRVGVVVRSQLEHS